MDRISNEAVKTFFKLTIASPVGNYIGQDEKNQKMEFIHGNIEKPKRKSKKNVTFRQEKTVGRNEQCPCGSGKKFKKCHGLTKKAINS